MIECEDIKFEKIFKKGELVPQELVEWTPTTENGKTYFLLDCGLFEGNIYPIFENKYEACIMCDGCKIYHVNTTIINTKSELKKIIKCQSLDTLTSIDHDNPFTERLIDRYKVNQVRNRIIRKIK